MSEKHTKEPWTRNHTEVRWGDITLIDNGRLPICEVLRGRTDEERAANANRIVACVNACAGLSTEDLERGIVRELIEALNHSTQSLRTFRNVPIEEQDFTEFDNSVLEDAFSLIAKCKGVIE